MLLDFIVRLQPVTLRITSRGTEKENKSKEEKLLLFELRYLY